MTTSRPDCRVCALPLACGSSNRWKRTSGYRERTAGFEAAGARADLANVERGVLHLRVGREELRGRSQHEECGRHPLGRHGGGLLRLVGWDPSLCMCLNLNL